MSWLNIDEFKALLQSEPLESIVQRYLFQGIPYVFRDQPNNLELLRSHLCKVLALSKESIIIVGSAHIGFSLSPDTFPRQFSDESDIDVVVVDTGLFDKVWLTMLKWNYPRRYRLMGVDWNWSRQRREELYWGWFMPDKIRYEGLSLPDTLKPVRDLSTAWFNAFRSLSQYQEFISRNISGRLYRTWDHALLYHAEGLREIKDAIQSMEEGA